MFSGIVAEPLFSGVVVALPVPVALPCVAALPLFAGVVADPGVVVAALPLPGPSSTTVSLPLVGLVPPARSLRSSC